MSALNYYNTHAQLLTQQYESLSAASVHSWLLDLLPKTKSLALDVGAGSGRDPASVMARRVMLAWLRAHPIGSNYRLV